MKLSQISKDGSVLLPYDNMHDSERKRVDYAKLSDECSAL